jgi:plastocyanin
MKTIARAVLIAAIGALVVGCGSSSSSTTSSPPPATTTSAPGAASPTTLKLTSPADGSLRFDQTHLTAKAGAISLSYTNPSSIPHGIAIESATGSIVSGGGTSTATITLKPGTYTFYCPVPGHRQAGMVGTITVT